MLERRAWGPLLGAAGLSTSARAAHAAVSPAAAALPSASAAAAAAPQGAYSVEIAVQGFEKRYVDMACNTLSDIIILAFAPKSYSALPIGAPSPSAAPVNLAFGPERRDVRLPWRRTRFSLIRGPHIDKTGMEQFERRQYKTVLAAATNCGQELARLLEAVKLYQFTGVQVKMELTSAQRVQLPEDVAALLRGGGASAPRGPSNSSSNSTSSTSSRSGSGSGSLVGSPVVDIPAPASAEAAFAAELGRVLGVLRPAVWAGLSKRRAALAGSADHEAWLKTAAPGLPPSASAAGGIGSVAAALPPPAAVAGWDAEAEAAAAEGGDAFGRLLRLRLRQQAQLHQRQATTSTSTPASGASAAAYGLDPSVAAQLLARIDAELLHAHEAAAAGLPPPAAAASAAAGSTTAAAPPAAAVLDAGKMSPAEYAYAVLKYVQYVDSLHEASGAAAAAARGDAGLQLAAPALAVRLLQLWWEATTVEFKRALGLPPAEEERRMLEKQLELQKRKEEVKGAGAGAGSGSGGRAR
ncbi:hypothetical protein HYH02_010268 [Chlamydomonas schloesseri]|uniref:Small ribosomal subunit protein uS10 domain-containing protein n=1 Tax=Chlamydomonas schloesseri TaxID=2026947 RepID=A0A835TL82_9CHLO|nr:hypothetical protein HYH02_010268 [Chlamydomonas schloesseri]|eukprot:KAG2440691.1 hypothetical protein HYH02_010268 [Chlamydomonas schloesseri]